MKWTPTRFALTRSNGQFYLFERIENGSRLIGIYDSKSDAIKARKQYEATGYCKQW